MKITAVSLIVLSTLLMGCGNDDSSPSATGPGPASKPLPEECTDQVLVAVDWITVSKDVYRYDFSLSVFARGPFYAHELDGQLRHHELSVDRGYKFSVQVTEILANGSTKYVTQDFNLPKCEERVAYQKSNPSYEEPVQVRLTIQ